MDNTSIRYGRVFLWIFALGWIIGGLIYAYAGIKYPVIMKPGMSFSSDEIRQFFLLVTPGWWAFLLAFLLFSIADFCLIPIGLILMRLFGSDDFRAGFIAICLMVGGIIGVIVDIMMISNWLVIKLFSESLSQASQLSLWTFFLAFQTIGLWLSTAVYVFLGLACYYVYKLSKEQRKFSSGWRLLTAGLVVIVILSTTSIIYGVISSNMIPFLILFLLAVILVAPSWAIGLARQLPRET